MRASRHFPLRFLVVVLANILTTYAGPTAFYFFDKKNNNGERIRFQVADGKCISGKLPDDWNSAWSTCLLINDIFEDPSLPDTSSVLIKQALLEAGRECNIVIVHWHLDGEVVGGQKRRALDVNAAFDFSTKAMALKEPYAKNLFDTAKEVAGFIFWLRQKVRKIDHYNGKRLEVTAFVHGMGGQIIGYAAQGLQFGGKKPIQTIIATDPMIQVWNDASKYDEDSNIITTDSAKRVIIINTNANGFGSYFVRGHLMFSINNEYTTLSDVVSVKRGTGAKSYEVKKEVQVQPGFMKDETANDKLYSHDLAVKFLAEQIMNPTTVTLEEYRVSEEMTLFGEGFPKAAIPPEGLQIKLSWKNDGPKLVAPNTWVVANPAEDAPTLK